MFKNCLLSLTVLCTLSCFKSISQTSSKEIFYAGSYSDRGSKGIYVYAFNRAEGNFTELQAVTEGKSPNFLAIHPAKKYLYAVYSEGKEKIDQNGRVMSFNIDPSTGFLTKINEVSAEGRGPAHISVDPRGRFVYVSNYGEGNFAVFKVGADGSLGKTTAVVKHTGSSINTGRQAAPHVHSIIPSADGNFIYVSDLGTDKIMIYKVDGNTGAISEATTPFSSNTPGSGPRHFAIHPNGRFGFSAEELTSTISSYKIDQSTGAMSPLEGVSMLPADFERARSSAADIHLSPDGKFLYASNRGHESLVIYSVNASTGKLKLIGFENTRGKHPRNFCVDNKGEYIFIANRDTDNITVFKRDRKTGKLQFKGEGAKTPAVVCIQQL